MLFINCFKAKFLQKIICLLLFLISPVGVVLSATNNDTFSAEGDGKLLPAAVEGFLKTVAPDTASSCGFLGREMSLSDSANDNHYYAIGPGEGGCIGSGGTTLWVVFLKGKKAKLLIVDVGFGLTKLDKVNYGLHNLKVTGGGNAGYTANEWAYDGSSYQLISNKFFEEKDCADSSKSKDPDFPWECGN